MDTAEKAYGHILETSDTFIQLATSAQALNWSGIKYWDKGVLRMENTIWGLAVALEAGSNGAGCEGCLL